MNSSRRDDSPVALLTRPVIQRSKSVGETTTEGGAAALAESRGRPPAPLWVWPTAADDGKSNADVVLDSVGDPMPSAVDPAGPWPTGEDAAKDAGNMGTDGNSRAGLPARCRGEAGGVKQGRDPPGDGNAWFPPCPIGDEGCMGLAV